MIIERTSPFTGKTHSMEINVTPEQIALWMNGAYIQDAMPHLSPSDREFIKTGITAQEWNDAFGTVEDEEEEE